MPQGLLISHPPERQTAAAARAPAQQQPTPGWPVPPAAALQPQLEHAQHHQQHSACAHRCTHTARHSLSQDSLDSSDNSQAVPNERFCVVSLLKPPTNYPHSTPHYHPHTPAVWPRAVLLLRAGPLCLPAAPPAHSRAPDWPQAQQTWQTGWPVGTMNRVAHTNSINTAQSRRRNTYTG